MNSNFSDGGRFFVDRWGWVIVPLVVLDVVLRGIALWRSARNGQNTWFIFLLIVNSLGILPACYLLTNGSIGVKKEKGSTKHR